MAISFVGAGAVASGQYPTVQVPSGIIQGDLLLLVYTVNYPINYFPTGWTVIGNQTISGTPYPFDGPNQVFLYKFAGGGETPVSINYLGDDQTRAVMLAYRGVSDVDVVGSFNSATNTNVSTLSQTTAFNNEYIISVFSTKVGTANTWTSPAGVSQRVIENRSPEFNGLLIVDELKSVAGPSTVRSASLSTSGLWASGSISLRPTGITSRNLYWVGESQNWDNTAGNKWSTTSGGAGGELPPTAADNVYFDDNSFGQIEIVNATANNLIITEGFTGYLGGYALGSLKVYGDFTLTSSMYWGFVGTLLFSSSTFGNNNITTAGNTLECTVEFNHVSGSWTLIDDLTVTNTVTLTNGNIVGNNKTLTCKSFRSFDNTSRSLSDISAINITGNNSLVLSATGSEFNTYYSNFDINLTYSGSIGTRQVFLGVGGDKGFGFFNFNVTAGSDRISLPTLGNYGGQGYGLLFVEDINFTGFSGTLDLVPPSIPAYPPSLRASDMTLSSSMTVIPGTAGWTIQGFSPTLSLAGKSLYSISLNNSGTVLLNSHMVLLSVLECAGSSFNANNYNVTIGSFIGRAQSGNFNMGNGTWTLNGPASWSSEIWRNDTSESNASQWISGNSTIVIADTTTPNVIFSNYSGHSSLSYNAIVIAGGNATNKITFQNPNIPSEYGDAGINRLGTVSSTRTSAYTITLPSNAPTIVDSWLVDGANSSNRVTLNSSVSGTPAVLSQSTGTVDVYNMIIKDSAATGGAGFYANNSQNNGNNTGWVFGPVPPLQTSNFFLLF
jgi:hypothetical protein